MIEGDQIFMHHPERKNAHIVGNITEITEHSMRIFVESGNYTLVMTVDNEIKGDYNEKISDFTAKTYC